MVEIAQCSSTYPAEVWDKGFKNICSYKREGYLDGGDSGGPLVFRDNGVERIIGINVGVRDSDLVSGIRGRSFFATHERMDLHSGWIGGTVRSLDGDPEKLVLTISNNWGSSCRVSAFNVSQDPIVVIVEDRSLEFGSRSSLRGEITNGSSNRFELSGEWIYATFVIRCEQGWGQEDSGRPPIPTPPT